VSGEPLAAQGLSAFPACALRPAQRNLAGLRSVVENVRGEAAIQDREPKTRGDRLLGSIQDSEGGRKGRIERMYEMYRRDALRLATALTGDAALAPDIVQTAFVRLLSTYRDLREQDFFYAYLRKTIVNLVRDSGRRAAVERRALGRLREGREDRAGQPDEAARFGSFAYLIDLIRALPQRQRTVLVLRYFEDLSEEQTAQVMGVSVSAVKALTNRAMTRLRESYEEDQ
jgi:RNA polymerase sigma factor (sigma-70 family)